LLDSFLIDQGILSPQRVNLLCIPDYLFFRNHPHRLYREFKGIPRYSIIARKVTDQLDYDSLTKRGLCTLKTIYIVDGSTALTNAPFYFPLAKKLDLSIIGTKLDFIELPKLRYMTTSNENYQKYEPTALVSNEVRYHASIDESGFDANSITLPPSFNLFPQPIIPITQNTIAVGSVREMNDFFPSSFDIMRINLGDFLEYTQLFHQELPTGGNAKKILKKRILEEIYNIISSFNISVILISLFKLAKFFALSDSISTSILNQVQEIGHFWKFSESLIINNERRRVWEEESINEVSRLFDAHGYVILFNQRK
jgi:hypothetical protein